MRVAISMVMLCFSLSVLGGCGGDSGSTATGARGASTKNGVPDADGNVPFEVLRRAVMAANAGDFDGAKQWIFPNSVMGTTEGGVDVLPRKWPPFTHNGQIAQIDFLSDEYNDMDAYVHYRLHFKDGSTFQERASLTKVDKRWKLTFMTETAPF